MYLPYTRGGLADVEIINRALGVNSRAEQHMSLGVPLPSLSATVCCPIELMINASFEIIIQNEFDTLAMRTRG
jgi:hypothetical protein